MKPVERVLAGLDEVRASGNRWKARCPAHVVDALGLTMADLYERRNGSYTRKEPTATWEIKDAQGVTQAEHVRFDREDGEKDCYWRLPHAKDYGLEGRKAPEEDAERITPTNI